MNPFSTKLKSFLDEKQVKIPDVERFTGINRSTLYKLINGQREPTDIETVYQLEDCLCLNHLQREELTEAYYLTRMGPLSYYGRKEVIKFYHELSLSKDYETSPFLPFAAIHLNDKERIVLNGVQNVNLAIEYFLYDAAQNQKDDEIILSETILDDVTLSIIQKIGKLFPEVRLSHLLMLDNTMEKTVATSHELYNINILGKLLPLAPKFPNYTVYYRYGSIQAEKTNPAYLPNVVIAGEYVIQYSSSHRYGIVTRDASVRELYSKLLSENKSISKPLFYSSSFQDWDNLSYLTGLQQVALENDPTYISLPGIFAYSILAKYGSQDPKLFSTLHINQKRMETFVEKNPYIINHKLIQGPGKTYLFSKASVDYFANYGRLSDIPNSWVNQLTVEERIATLQRWVLQVHQCNLIMIDFPEISTPVSIFSVATMSKVIFVRMDEELHAVISAEIQEPSIVHAFYDFWDELVKDKEYSQEDTIRYIEEKIRELQERVS